MELAFRLPGRTAFTIAAKAWSTHTAYVQSLRSAFPPQAVQLQLVKEKQPSPAAVNDVTFDEASVYQTQKPSASKTSSADHHSPPPAVAQTELKWQQVHTVLALHGWLDNASSYDELIPALLTSWSQRDPSSVHVVIALDFAGHGFSSYRPWLAGYAMHAYVRDCLAVTSLLGWQQYGLLGHSMGGGVACLLAAAFPSQTRYLVSIENIGPISRLEKDSVSQLRTYVHQSLALLGKKLPAYATQEDALKARLASDPTLHASTVWPMVQRGLRRHPEQEDHWTWKTDPSLVTVSGLSYSEPQVLKLMEAIECPSLFVLGRQGYKLLSTDGKRPFDWIDWEKRMRVLRQTPLRLEFEGGHHVHLEPKSYEQGLAQQLAAFMQLHYSKSRAKM